GYAANVELARSTATVLPAAEMTEEEVHTPEKRTVAEVSAFLGLPHHVFLKSILVIAQDEPVLALLRGDQSLHEKKLQRVVGHFRQAARDEVLRHLGVEAGFIGPRGHRIRMVADEALREGKFVSGANRPHYHVKGVRGGVDFEAEWADIHVARKGDGCPECGRPLDVERVIEIGNIFKLGTKYSSPLKAVYLDEVGTERPIIMGSYGIGPARIAAAAVEQSHDDNGIIWPPSISPFDLIILPLNMKDERTRDTAELLYGSAIRAGIDALLDDRDERAGIKFKDADLIGIPLSIIVGEKALREGLVEIKERKTGISERVNIAQAVAFIAEKCAAWKAQKSIPA
ncbi:MAG: YbaK/EbsC family protein, partial [Thermodesulfovibrionales bacterium]